MIEQVITIVKEAGKILLSFQKKGLSVKDKGIDGLDPVTDADLAAHNYIVKKLGEIFPEDQILSEEDKERKINFDGRVWMIDPLDGTKQFIKREEGFSIVVGLCIGGVPSLGVVGIPLKEEIYYAELGKGAFFQKEDKTISLKVDDVNKLSESVLFIKPPSKRFRHFEGPINSLNVKEKMLGGSIATKLCDIASCNAHLYVHPSKKLCKWDTCGSQVILTEAGGRITDLEGNELDYEQVSTTWDNSIIASNSKIHQEVIDALKNYGK